MLRNMLPGFLLASVIQGCQSSPVDSLQWLNLPPGFKAEVWAEIPHSRSLALGEAGTVFVGTRRDDKVYALQDTDDNGLADRKIVIAENLDMPNGVAFHAGALYVAEMHRIQRFPDIEARLDNPAGQQIALLPDKPHHGWRYIDFGPDGRLYVSIGAPCNVCDEPGFGMIVSMNPDGSDRETYAVGVRNSVGFDWRPGTNTLWFSDNGRDWLGDDLPADEINRATGKGLDFGFPWCHGGDLPDADYRKDTGCAGFEKPVLRLPAHVAPLGLLFYTGQRFPDKYKNSLFVALHGSWNRSSKVGYKVLRLEIKEGEVVNTEEFATGWLDSKGEVRGRPVDLLQLPDGSLLLSDDKAGRIYRIFHER